MVDKADEVEFVEDEVVVPPVLHKLVVQHCVIVYETPLKVAAPNAHVAPDGKHE